MYTFMLYLWNVPFRTRSFTHTRTQWYRYRFTSVHVYFTTCKPYVTYQTYRQARIVRICPIIPAMTVHLDLPQPFDWI